MGKDTRTMGSLNIDLSRKIGETITEVELLLKSTAKSNFFPDQNRKTLNKKCLSIASYVRLYVGEEKKKLTKTQTADLQIFENNAKTLASRVLVEKSAESLIPVVQALRDEYIDLFD